MNTEDNENKSKVPDVFCIILGLFIYVGIPILIIYFVNDNYYLKEIKNTDLKTGYKNIYRIDVYDKNKTGNLKEFLCVFPEDFKKTDVVHIRISDVYNKIYNKNYSKIDIYNCSFKSEKSSISKAGDYIDNIFRKNTNTSNQVNEGETGTLNGGVGTQVTPPITHQIGETKIYNGSTYKLESDRQWHKQ